MDAAKMMWLLYEVPTTDFKGLSQRFMDPRKRIYEVRAGAVAGAVTGSITEVHGPEVKAGATAEAVAGDVTGPITEVHGPTQAHLRVEGRGCSRASTR